MSNGTYTNYFKTFLQITDVALVIYIYILIGKAEKKFNWNSIRV